MSDLYVESVRHSFSGKSILNCNYTKFKYGAVTGVIGINGCGKSTLFKILFGTLKADYSRILYKDNQVKSLFTHSGSVAFLFQDNFLPRYLSLNKFLKQACLSPEKDSFLRERFKPVIKQKIRTLSGGERRMLEIQYIFALDRDFLILDEPFIGLEPRGIEETKQLIGAYKKGIIISSHLYRDLADELDVTLLLVNGYFVKIESDDDLRKFGYLPRIEEYQET